MCVIIHFIGAIEFVCILRRSSLHHKGMVRLDFVILWCRENNHAKKLCANVPRSAVKADVETEYACMHACTQRGKKCDDNKYSDLAILQEQNG